MNRTAGRGIAFDRVAEGRPNGSPTGSLASDGSVSIAGSSRSFLRAPPACRIGSWRRTEAPRAGRSGIVAAGWRGAVASLCRGVAGAVHARCGRDSAMPWSAAYAAFVSHVAACYTCGAARPLYCATAVEFHAALRRKARRLR